MNVKLFKEVLKIYLDDMFAESKKVLISARGKIIESFINHLVKFFAKFFYFI